MSWVGVINLFHVFYTLPCWSQAYMQISIRCGHTKQVCVVEVCFPTCGTPRKLVVCAVTLELFINLLWVCPKTFHGVGSGQQCPKDGQRSSAYKWYVRAHLLNHERTTLDLTLLVSLCNCVTEPCTYLVHGSLFVLLVETCQLIAYKLVT